MLHMKAEGGFESECPQRRQQGSPPDRWLGLLLGTFHQNASSQLPRGGPSDDEELSDPMEGSE